MFEEQINVNPTLRSISCVTAALTWALVTLLTDAGTQAAAAPSPERPVRLVVGFPPGGATDTIARIIGPRLSEALGAPWVVDNRGGASGNLATELVARSVPDGHTVLLAVNSSLTSSPFLYKLPVDVDRDLQPVIMMATAQYMLTVNASVKATNVKAFVELARSVPGKINYASAGIGTPQHLAGELFKLRAGIDMNHVPYKGGGPAAVALLSNEIPAMFGSLPSLIEHVKAGRLRALAVTGPKRAAISPGVPTVAESGYSGFEITSTYGLLVRASTPSTIVDRLYRTSRHVLEMPEVGQSIQREGLEVTIKDPTAFARYLEEERNVMAKLIKAARIRVD